MKAAQLEIEDGPETECMLLGKRDGWESARHGQFCLAKCIEARRSGDGTGARVLGGWCR